MTDTAAILARHAERHVCATSDGHMALYEDGGCDAHQLGVALEDATDSLANAQGRYRYIEAREARLRAALERIEALAGELDFGLVSRGEAAFIIRAALATEAE